MYYELINENGKRFVKLNIGDITLPPNVTPEVRPAVEKCLMFTVRTYVNLKKKVVADVSLAWNNIFEPVNRFISTLTHEEQAKLAMTIATISYKIRSFVVNKSLDQVNQLMKGAGEDILVLHREIDLCPKLKAYVLANVPIGDFSAAGSRAQDTPEMTFHQFEVEDLLAVVLLCKMLSPLFSTFMDIAQSEIDISSAHDKFKEIVCASMLTAILNECYKERVEKLQFYVDHLVSRSFKEDTSSIFNGQTASGLVTYAFNSLFVRNFVNLNLYRRDGNLMKFISSVAKVVVQSQTQGGGGRMQVRVRTPYGDRDDDRGNYAQLDVDAVITDMTCDTVEIVASAVEPAVEATLLRFEIPEELHRAATEYHLKRQTIVPSSLNIFMVSSYFAPHFGGSWGVRMLNLVEFTPCVVVLQLLCWKLELPSLVHAITAGASNSAKPTPYPSDVELQLQYSNSFAYRNCKEYMEKSPLGEGGKRWDTVMNGLVKDLVGGKFLFNTAPDVWDALGQESANGSEMVFPRTIIADLSSFFEQTCMV